MKRQRPSDVSLGGGQCRRGFQVVALPELFGEALGRANGTAQIIRGRGEALCGKLRVGWEGAGLSSAEPRGVKRVRKRSSGDMMGEDGKGTHRFADAAEGAGGGV